MRSPQRGIHEKVAILAGIQALPEDELVKAREGKRTLSNDPANRAAPRRLVRKPSGPAIGRDRAGLGHDQAAFRGPRTARFRHLRRWRLRHRVGDHRASGTGEQLAVPAKYAIHTKPAAPRVRPVGKLGIVDWREDCSSCHNCVKRACVYGLYRDESDALRDEVGLSRLHLSVQGLPQLRAELHQEHPHARGQPRVPPARRLATITPDIILSTWFQAESGRIPVSGSGYGGPFSGPGFDSMWTDMSEIVRPTRDGIHGREYINTSVDIGRKLPHLPLVDGRLSVSPPPLTEIPFPVIFDIIPEYWQRGRVVAAIAAGAAAIGTLAIIRDPEIMGGAGDALMAYQGLAQ